MRAVISNVIRIENPTPACRAFFVEKLIFSNPEFAKKEHMGLWTGGTPRVISLITSSADWIEVPFGMLGDVFAHKSEYSEILNGVPTRKERIDYASAIKPYTYQEEAIQAAFRQRNGVIVAPCGSGKTQIDIELIARLGLRALWLTHTGDLLKQSMERAKAVLDIDPDTYGTITEGKINIGKSITFATVQTMCKIDLDSVAREWDVIIVDEAHHIVGTPTKLQMFYKVISKLCARYKFGLTATPTRADGLIACMYALLGDKVYEVTRQQVKDNSCPIRVFMEDIDYVPNFDVVLASDGTLQYTSLITDMTENEERNKQITEDIYLHSGTGLVLTDRIQHVQTLAKTLNAMGKRCLTLYGSVSKRKREECLDALKNGDADLIVATYSLAKEGLDIPCLDNVFFATPQRNETIVIQSAGRASR